jgi:formate/nitrite transporter FocA (FNT family)
MMFALLLPFADVSGAFNGLASLFVSWLAAILGFILVVNGYQYMFTLDDERKASHAKRAIAAAIGGGILVAIAVGLSPSLVTSFGK